MDKQFIVPIGDVPEAIFPALREFTVSHVHMLIHDAHSHHAEQLKKDLEKFGISHSSATITDNLWEDIFVRIGEFAKNAQHPEHLYVHVGTGDRAMQCAATSAAFVNGLRAFNGGKDSLFALPIMKFSYYTLLQERKLKILESLASGTRSLSDISEDLGISLSLLSYHVHGNRKSEGLVEMGLVEIEEKDSQTYLMLSAMGRLLLKGYLPECEVC